MLNEIDLSRADLNLLVLFEVVLEEGHVGRASKRLNLSPSAISHGLTRLRRLLNDPLFLRTPKGVVPTARALELAAPIAEVLAHARRVIATAEPFDPLTSRRHVTLGAPDAIAAVVLPPLLADLRRLAPGIDVRMRLLLATKATQEHVFAELDSRTVDIALLPTDESALPGRFAAQLLFEEDFVIAARPSHPFVDDPSLDRYCDMQHLLVSVTGDPHGYFDRLLAEQGRSRRVALTVPNFLLALALIAETDLIGAVPRKFAATHAKRFGIEISEAPLSQPPSRICAIAPKVALMDGGLAWLFGAIREAVKPEQGQG